MLLCIFKSFIIIQQYMSEGGLPSPGLWRDPASGGAVQVSLGLVDKRGKDGA